MRIKKLARTNLIRPLKLNPIDIIQNGRLFCDQGE